MQQGQDKMNVKCGVKFERRFTTKLIALEQHEKLKLLVGSVLMVADHSSYGAYEVVIILVESHIRRKTASK